MFSTWCLGHVEVAGRLLNLAGKVELCPIHRIDKVEAVVVRRVEHTKEGGPFFFRCLSSCRLDFLVTQPCSPRFYERQGGTFKCDFAR